MKTLSSVGLCMLLAAGAAGCAEAHADDRRDPRRAYATDAGAADPSASAAAPELPPARDGGPVPWAPSFETSFPDEASPEPTAAEWKAAPDARDVRLLEPGCKAQRVREWYRIACGIQIEMISGQREGVSFECPRSSPDSLGCDPSAVRFPARRGDRRAFQILGWSKWGPEPDAFLTEQFIDGDPAPMVSAHGLHWGY